MSIQPDGRARRAPDIGPSPFDHSSSLEFLAGRYYAATEGLRTVGKGFMAGRFFFSQSAISPRSKRIAPEILNEGMVPLAAIL